MRHNYRIWITLVTFAILLLGPGIVSAHEEGRSTSSNRSGQQLQEPAEPATSRGYPVRKRRIGGPTDVEWDLDSSFPKRGSLLELILRCLESQES